MAIKTKNNWPFGLAILISLFLILLAGWWIYLLFKLANIIKTHVPNEDSHNLIFMLQWEGPFFLLALILMLAAFAYLWWRDLSKTKNLQAFFSSLTHELKTPLASIKLQGQILQSLIEDLKLDQEKQNKLLRYTKRLSEDTMMLELQMEKSLQLSRLEQDGPLSFQSIKLKPFIEMIHRDFPIIKLTINDDKSDVWADEFALKIIFKNLFENSINHGPATKNIHIKIESTKDLVHLAYTDHGQSFAGNMNKLGELFYKYQSPQGTGIGLYLIKNLTTKMGGHFQIENNDSLIFKLILTKVRDGDDDAQ